MRRAYPPAAAWSAILHTVAICAALAGPARAQIVQNSPGLVRAEGQTRSVTCAGGPAEVAGNRNTLAFFGACRNLRIRGAGNTVSVQLASNADLDIEGSDNHIRYTVLGAGARPPSVRVSGNNIDLAPEPGMPAPFAPSQAMALTGDGERLEFDCADRPVAIHGNRSRYVLRGGCRSLVIHGDGNGVTAELMPGATVEIEGNGTALSYTTTGPGEPGLNIRGTNSAAVRAGGAAPPPLVAGLPVPVPAPVSGPPPLPSVAVAPTSLSAPAPSVPILMHDLAGQVVEEGTLIAFQSADKLFDGATAALHNDAPARLASVVQLIRQINPSGLRITVRNAGDSDLAKRRGMAIRQWLGEAGQVNLPIRTVDADTAGAPAITVLILR